MVALGLLWYIASGIAIAAIATADSHEEWKCALCGRQFHGEPGDADLCDECWRDEDELNGEGEEWD